MIGHQFGVAWAIRELLLSLYTFDLLGCEAYISFLVAVQAGRGSRSDATQHFHICLRGHLTSGIWCHERVGGKWIRHMDFLLTLYPMQPGISLGVSGQGKVLSCDCSDADNPACIVYFTEIHFHGAVFHNLLVGFFFRF